MKGIVVRVLNPSKRSGQGDKGPWNIMELEVEKEDGSIIKADTFDTVVDKDTVELTPNSYTSPKTGQTYEGWNAKLPKANNFSKPAGPDQTEVLQAIRMLYREIKEVHRKVDLLMGPPDEDSQPNPQEGEVAPVKETKPWDKWASADEPDGDPNEPHLEPMPDEPQDLESFMNG